MRESTYGISSKRLELLQYRVSRVFTGTNEIKCMLMTGMKNQ